MYKRGRGRGRNTTNAGRSSKFLDFITGMIVGSLNINKLFDDDSHAICVKEGDFNELNFVDFINPLLQKDGKNGKGFVKLKMDFMIDELKQMTRNVERSICEEVTVQTHKNRYVKEGILELKRSDTIPSDEDPKASRSYLYQPYWSYLTSDQRYQSANPDSSDQEILDIGTVFYQNELIPGYISEYSVIDSAIMKGSKFNLENIQNTLKYCNKCAGLNSGFLYLGRRGTQSCVHQEDFHVPSLNLCFKGIKLWTVLNYENSVKLEKVLSSKCIEDFAACSFATNHKSYSISPMFLDKHYIDYTLVIQKPGDLIITNVGCHHMVANLSPTIAYAINISVPYIMEYDDPPVCDCNEKRDKAVLGIDLVRKYEGLLIKSNDQMQKIVQLEKEMEKEKKLNHELKGVLEENWKEKDIFIKYMGEKEIEFKREINTLKEAFLHLKRTKKNNDHDDNTLMTDVVVESTEYSDQRKMTNIPYESSSLPIRRVHFSRQSTIDKSHRHHESTSSTSIAAGRQISLLRKEQKAKCVCPFCGFFISNEGNLRRHILSCLGIKSYSCSICNREYAREENLKDHLKSYHHSDAMRTCYHLGSMDDNNDDENNLLLSSH